jgi:membrane-bound lytic murein transglycosylase B
MAMKRAWMCVTASASLTFGCTTVNQAAIAQSAKPQMVHDAEYYYIQAAQHGQQCAAEDQDIDRELRQKYGVPPNIIHIMWDNVTAAKWASLRSRFETPNINRLAANGINRAN